MPQILTLAGYKSFWAQRGASRADHPAEFIWEGIDGTRIPAFLLPNTYALFYGSPGSLDQFNAFTQQRWNSLNPHATGPNRVALAGADVTEPDDSLPQMIGQYQKQPKPALNLRFGTPTEYEAAVAKHAPLSVYKGELNPIFQGTFSSRIELKQMHRLLEQRLTLAEKLACLSNMLGTPADSGLIWRGWEPLLFNSAHDLASGVMTNGVYADTLRGFDFSRRIADDAVDTNFNALASRVDTRGDGIAAIVFNSLGWPRTDLAELTVGFSDPGVQQLGALDPAGNAAPLQMISETRYADGGIKTADVAFIARDVPTMGYATYRIVPRAATAPGAAFLTAKPDGLENEFYRLTLDPKTGAITGLRVKEGDWEVFRAPANVVTRQEDKGDFWSLYRGLNGAQKLFIADKEAVPQTGQAKFSNEFTAGDPPKVAGGPVFAEFNLFHAFDDGTFATRVRIYAGSRRIDLRTQLVNRQRQVRYQALFPTTI